MICAMEQPAGDNHRATVHGANQPALAADVRSEEPLHALVITRTVDCTKLVPWHGSAGETAANARLCHERRAIPVTTDRVFVANFIGTFVERIGPFAGISTKFTTKFLRMLVPGLDSNQPGPASECTSAA